MTLPSDPAPYIIACGFVLTAILTFRFGARRGTIWSALVSTSAAIIWWLYGVAEAVVRDGGTSDSSRFSIWAGLLMGVPLILLFYWIGGSLGAALGLTSRHITRRRAS